MTFAQIYAEIIKRAGEGYDNYLDRAEACFWKAVTQIIDNGDFTDTEIRLMSTRFTKVISKSDFSGGLYNILRIWNDVLNPNPSLSPFYDRDVFKYSVQLTPISPEYMRFTQVNPNKVKDGHILSAMTAITGIKELIWGFDYPQLMINTLTDIGDYRVMINLSTYSIPKTAKSNSATDADAYMNYSFTVRAIELATQILKSETE